MESARDQVADSSAAPGAPSGAPEVSKFDEFPKFSGMAGAVDVSEAPAPEAVEEPAVEVPEVEEAAEVSVDAPEVAEWEAPAVAEDSETAEATQFIAVPTLADRPAEVVEATEAAFPEVDPDSDEVAEITPSAACDDSADAVDEEAPPVPAPRTEAVPAKNNPAVLTGVFTMIMCSVLGLGLIGQMDNSRTVTGHAVAAPMTATPTTSTSTEPPRPRAVQRLEDHPLLVKPTSLPQVSCDLPRFGTSDTQLAAYYAAGVLCLDAAWGPVLQAANLPFDPPALDASPQLSDGPCGGAPDSGEAVAYYCGRNRMIYMPTQRLRENGGGDRPGTHLATLAHEYGHHVQAMSGILRAADSKIVNAGEKTPAGLEMSRRIELQANCFAGMFLSAAAGRGSITKELANRAEEDFQYAMEEPPDKNAHGSPANQGTWALNGFEANSTDSCNTYAAPAAAVG